MKNLMFNLMSMKNKFCTHIVYLFLLSRSGLKMFQTEQVANINASLRLIVGDNNCEDH